MDSKNLPEQSGNESTEEILNLMGSKLVQKTGSFLMPVSRETKETMQKDKKDTRHYEEKPKDIVPIIQDKEYRYYKNILKLMAVCCLGSFILSWMYLFIEKKFSWSNMNHSEAIFYGLFINSLLNIFILSVVFGQRLFKRISKYLYWSKEDRK